MKHPNFREEKKLWRAGYKRVVGLDEAGRGPLAGPVVAAAVIVRQIPVVNSFGLKKLLQQWQIQGIRDSKKLTPKKREELYEMITKHPHIEWGIGRTSEKVIDKINILEATKLAMERAVRNLERKSSTANFLILDGNFGIKTPHPQTSIIKADEKVFSCAAASIIAKVFRDRMMLRYHRKYPQYGFDRHKGYPTKLHRKMLKKHGHSVIHRLTFNFVKKGI